MFKAIENKLRKEKKIRCRETVNGKMGRSVSAGVPCLSDWEAAKITFGRVSVLEFMELVGWHLETIRMSCLVLCITLVESVLHWV